MITFIFDDNNNQNDIINGIGIDNQKSPVPYCIVSKAIRDFTIKECIDDTPGLNYVTTSDVTFSNNNIYIYPVFVTEMLNTFGFHVFGSHLDNIIDSIFKFLPENIIQQARVKKLYIAVFSICEGKAYNYENWSCIKEECKKYGVPESQILITLCGNHTKYDVENATKRSKLHLHLNYYALELNRKIKSGYVELLEKQDPVKQKHYICLNSQIKHHRYHLVSNLYHNNLLKHGFVSCQSYSSHLDNYAEIDNIYSMKEKLRKDGADIQQFIEFYNSLPYTVDVLTRDNFINQLHGAWTYDPNPQTIFCSGYIDELYKSSIIDVVTETALLDNHVNFISEKTFKSIMFKMPFIISGDKGNNKELLRHGFKLYDMLFDYSFDDFDSYIDRNNAITKQLKAYCEMPLEEFADRVKQDDVQEVIQHNFELLSSNKIWNDFIDSLFLRLGVNKPI